MNKEKVQGILGIILLYAIVLIGIVLVNARLGEMQNKSAVAETTTQIAR